MALPTTFNELAICAGYGGLGMGLKLAVPTTRTVCYVEREAASVEILVARMQNGSLDQAPIWSDLCTFDGKPWRGAVDIITAGIPCQPWSLAGKQAGFDDERHLGEELVRVVSEVEPSFVFVENVSGFVRLGAPDLLGRLASLGFDAEWGLLSASDVGAPHRRQRFFMLAYRRGVAHPNRERGQQGPSDNGPQAAAQGSSQQQHATRGGRGPSKQPDRGESTPQSPLRGVANGSAPRMGRVDQLRMLGNGVVPLQAAHAFRSLVNRLPTTMEPNENHPR